MGVIRFLVKFNNETDLKQVWSTGERRFSHSHKIRMMMFDSIVKSVMTYGVEIWGWRQYEELEAVQVKYLKWVLGLSKITPTYIVKNECKREKLSISAGGRAMDFEEKLRKEEKPLLQACWKELKERKRRGNETRWDKDRRKWYEGSGFSTEEVENMRTRGENVRKIVQDRISDVEKQEEYNKMERSRYCPRFQKIKAEDLPGYLQKEWKKSQIQKIARFRCGCAERGSQHWRREEERKCRLCNLEKETVEHWIEDCKELPRRHQTVEEVLAETGDGFAWIQMVSEKIDKKERL